MAMRARDRRESECCSVMGQISVASVLFDYITVRESGQTSPWCCTRENLINRFRDKADDDSQNCWCGLQRSGGMVCH
jgi:hypothetical protein